VRRIFAMRRTIFFEIAREAYVHPLASQSGSPLIHLGRAASSTSSGSRTDFPVVLDIENSHIHKTSGTSRDIYV
jgi:hypothetical protein